MYNKIKEKISKNKKTTKKNFEKIEKEYQKIKEQRIQEDKKLWQILSLQSWVLTER